MQDRIALGRLVLVLSACVALLYTVVPGVATAQGPASGSAVEGQPKAEVEAEVETEAEVEAAKARIDFIAQGLEADAAHARRWWWGFIGAYGAVTVAQTVPVAMWWNLDESGATASKSDKQHRDTQLRLRANFLVGGVSSGLGVLALLVSPLRAADGAAGLQASLPAEGGGHLSVALAETYLSKCADEEAFTRSWISHGVAAAVALTEGLVLWQYFDYPADAATTVLTSMLVSELQIYLAPTGAIATRAAYQRQFGEAHTGGIARTTPAPTPPPQVRWTLALGPRTAMVRMTF